MASDAKQTLGLNLMTLIKGRISKMKRTKLLGVVCAAALTLVLAACVYDEAGMIPHDGGGQQPVQQEPQGNVLFTNITGEQTIRVSVPYQATRNNADTTVLEPLTGPESVAALANSGAWSNLVDSQENAAPLVLDVTFSPSRIVDIRLISHAETFGIQPTGTNGGVSYLQMVYPALTDQVVFHQSTLNVDAFSHATVTRNAFIRGINDAIAEAGGDATALVPQNQNATTPPAGARFIPGVVNVYVPAGRYVVMDRTANALDIREITPALALELGMVNAEGGPVNAAIQRHGVIHNGFRRQATPEINERMGIADPARGAISNPESPYAPHYFHSATMGTNNINSSYNSGLLLAMNNSLGLNLQPGDPNPLYGQPRGIWMQISFGFNSFWVNERGTRPQDNFSGLVLGGHGETMTGGFANARQFGDETFTPPNDANAPNSGTPAAVNNNTLGSYWMMARPALSQINDHQSTHNIDAYTNATMTMLGLRVAVEKAMVQQGANVAQITPIPDLFRLPRPVGASTGNPGGANGLVLRPSLTQTTVGGVNFEILMDRGVIRQFRTNSGNEAAIQAIIPGWTNANFNAFSNSVLFMVASNRGDQDHIAAVAELPLMEGIDAGLAAEIRQAVVDALNANDLTHIDQSNRLGYSRYGTGKDRLPPTPR
jgi:uncharacterized protein with FMN-binding domain